MIDWKDAPEWARFAVSNGDHCPDWFEFYPHMNAFGYHFAVHGRYSIRHDAVAVKGKVQERPQ